MEVKNWLSWIYSEEPSLTEKKCNRKQLAQHFEIALIIIILFF